MKTITGTQQRPNPGELWQYTPSQSRWRIDDVIDRDGRCLLVMTGAVGSTRYTAHKPFDRFLPAASRWQLIEGENYCAECGTMTAPKGDFLCKQCRTHN